MDDVVPEDMSRRWLGARRSSDDSIIVSNGQVYLTTKYYTGLESGTSITTHNKLKGDFELNIKFSDFDAMGDYDFSNQLVFELPFTDGSNPVVNAYLTKENLYLQDSLGAGPGKSTVNRNGEFHLKRTGSDVHAWIRAGSDSVFFDRANYYAKELTVKIRIFSGDNSSTKTAVKIDDILIVGGGGLVKSNTFDKNTIRIIE